MTSYRSPGRGAWPATSSGWPSGRSFGRWLSRVAIAAVVAAALAGCGNLTAGGVASGEAIVTGDGSEGAFPSSPDAATSPGDPARMAEGEAPPVPDDAPRDQVIGPPFEGTLSLSLSVFLLRPDADPLEISRGERDVTVGIDGRVPVSLGPVSIPPGTYVGVRVVFTRVEAIVTSGLGGLPLLTSGTVTIDFGGEPSIVVEKEMAATVREDGHLVATVDLRAPAWIQTVALGTPRVVPAAVFRSLVQLSLEGD